VILLNQFPEFRLDLEVTHLMNRLGWGNMLVEYIELTEECRRLRGPL
jgi:hypothetical protein